MKRSLSYNIICAVCSAILAALFQVLFCFAKSMLSQMILIVATSVLFLIPFIINLKTIKSFQIDKIRRFVLCDLLFVILPVALISVITEVILTPVAEVRLADGIGSLILISVLLLEAIIFWVLYFLFDKLS